MSKVLTKNNYLWALNNRFPFISKSINDASTRHWVGKLVQIQLTLEKGNFYLSLAVKAKYMNASAFFSPCDWLKCVCIGIENRGFGSSIRVRFVDSGVLVERKLHICSPFLVDMFIFKHTKAKQKLKAKAKLYYFNPTVLKKYLNIHYYN